MCQSFCVFTVTSRAEIEEPGSCYRIGGTLSYMTMPFEYSRLAIVVAADVWLPMLQELMLAGPSVLWGEALPKCKKCAPLFSLGGHEYMWRSLQGRRRGGGGVRYILSRFETCIVPVCGSP